MPGLSSAEAAARRAAGQGNAVRLSSSRSYWQILRENAFTFINTILFAIGILLVLMRSIDNALVTAGLVLLNVIVGVIQEGRAKRTLDRIALLTRPKANVLRDGQEQTLDPAEIVTGDVLVVRPGDQIVVDGQVVGADSIAVDESLLTGESDPITRAPGEPVLSGSFCVSGHGLYEASRVGAESFVNRLTAEARTFRRIKTPLQNAVDFVVRMMVLLASLLGILLSIAAILQRMPFVETVQIAAVIVVLVPQGLFFMTTVTYATGALRMAGRGALVQQANAIESMANVDTLCLDKTGTLTTNRMLLQGTWPVDHVDPGEFDRCLGEFVASARDRNRTAEAIAGGLKGQARAVASEVPFSSERKWSALWYADDAAGYVLGAPEMLAPGLAHAPAEHREAIDGQMTGWAGEGLRVLLFARTFDPAPTDGTAAPEDGGRPITLPARLEPLGLVSLSDELRPDAQDTLAAFNEAGIRLKIISGDNPETVAALARQAGFCTDDDRAVSGLDLADLDDEAFAAAADQGQIFGRITPEQKARLVLALRKQGHYVAMIGDGVNDVLSLKNAQLGIAMQAGSGAARSVSDIVLLDNSFAALPAAFREGQRIVRGMLDIMRLFVSRTLYITLLILGASVAGTAFPVTPKHNFILALLTVGIPTVFLGMWAQPGRTPGATRERGAAGAILMAIRHFMFPAAFTVAVAGLGVYFGYLLAGHSPFVARSALTTTLVLCGILLIVFVEPPTAAWAGGDELSGDRRPAFLALVMLVLYALVLALPASRQFFALAPLHLVDILIAAGVTLAWAAVVMLIWRHDLFERMLRTDE